MSVCVPSTVEHLALGGQSEQFVGSGDVVEVGVLLVDDVGVGNPELLQEGGRQRHGGVELVKLQSGVSPHLAQKYRRLVVLKQHKIPSCEKSVCGVRCTIVVSTIEPSDKT